MTDRPTLEADLERYRQNGDFAAQAETLFALAELVAETAYEDASFHLVQGLYGQAWEAYEKAGDISGQARALRKTAESMFREFWNHEDDTPLEFDLLHIRQMRELALILYIEAGDLRGQAEVYVIIGEAERDRDNERKALQKALQTYEVLGDIAQQAKILAMLADRCYREPEYRSYLERAFKLYMQIGDKRRAGYKCSALAELDHYEKSYEAARIAFQTAQTLFREVKDSVGLIHVIINLGDLILEADGYPAYVRHYQKTLHSLEHEPIDKCEMFAFWHKIPKIACKHQDFQTARYAYQHTIVCATACGQPQRQSDLYWKWGYMEYYESGHKAMGFALCQWAMTLFQIYVPGSTDHRKQFAKMRQDLHSPRNLRK
jgi:tetratricopeptide (TPR) repeat protein